MRAKEYKVLEMAISEGAAFGWRRAFKHAENAPIITEAQLADRERAFCEEITTAICEWFDHEENEKE